MMPREVVILSACRTPVGRYLGSLAEVPAVRLGAVAIEEAVSRSQVDPDDVGEVVMGHVLQAGLGQNTARQAAVLAGLSNSVPAMTVNKVCGSGIKAVELAAQTVALGDTEVAVGGGMESMSRAPYVLDRARLGYRMGDGVLVDEMIKDGLWCAFTDVHMGITAENVAERYGISREMQDVYAAESQRRAGAAIEAGKFESEIVPVDVPAGRKQTVQVDKDEHPRPDATVEQLSKLRTAFKEGGTVTAGNASGLNDAGAAVVVASRAYAEKHGLEPMATILEWSSAGLHPEIMGMGPYYATRRLLDKSGMSLDDFDFVEANEAFASQTLAVAKELGLDADRTNVYGGAIALGHPIGASGTRVLVTLLSVLRQEGGRTGLATLCIGGGQGIAMAVRAAG